jgi:putative FmdB family regulatory protein
MPIYEYKCETCGTLFSHQAAMSAAPLQVKPDCESGECRLEKLISRCSAVIAGRNVISAMREASAAASTQPAAPKSEGHACSFYCDHK